MVVVFAIVVIAATDGGSVATDCNVVRTCPARLLLDRPHSKLRIGNITHPKVSLSSFGE